MAEKPKDTDNKVVDDTQNVGVKVKEGVKTPSTDPTAKVVKTSAKAKKEANAPDTEPLPGDTPPVELDITNPAHGNLTYDELQSGKENKVKSVKTSEPKPFTGEAKAEYLDVNNPDHANLTYDELQTLAASKRK